MSDRALELASASLTILESLILALKEEEILTADEIAGAFEDARNAHRGAAASGNAQFHENVAGIIAQLAETEDSVNLLRDIDANPSR